MTIEPNATVSSAQAEQDFAENSETEELSAATDEEVEAVSRRLIEKNLEAYKELAK